jgi:hypothetical protein
VASRNPDLRPSRPSAEQVRASLQRTLGAEAGEAFWADICGKAGFAPDGVNDLEGLLKVADVMTTYGGPVAVSGVSLVIRIRAYQVLSGSASVNVPVGAP